MDETTKPPRRSRVEYAPQLGQEIGRRLAEGMSVLAISRLDGMPTSQTIARWSRELPDFARIFAEMKAVGAGRKSGEWKTSRAGAARAKPEFNGYQERSLEATCDRLREQMVEIADAATPESLARDKVRIAVRQWWAGQAPRAEAATTDKSGGKPRPIINVRVVRFGDEFEPAELLAAPALSDEVVEVS